ncbi:MAG: SCO family protein [Thermomicrobiales bacterium]
MTRKHLGAIAAAGVAVIAAVALSWFLFFRSEPYEFTSGSFNPPNAAYPLDLIDQDGQPFSLQDFKGDVVLLYFGYTFCPSFCPTTMADMQQVKQELGADADRVAVVMVTVDPDRDTPERLKQWMAFFDPSFIGLSGTEEQLKLIKREYGVTAIKASPEAGQDYYLVDHSTQLYGIDPDGNLRLSWPYGAAPDAIAEDVRHLLHP